MQCHSRGQSLAERSVESEAEGVKVPRSSGTGVGQSRDQSDEAGCSKYREGMSQCKQWTHKEILEVQDSDHKVL